MRYKFANTLPAIPDNVRVDTEVATLKNREFQLYTVEEFIDRQGRSIQVRAKDEFPVSPNDSSVVNYYRIREVETKSRVYGDFVTLYNHRSLCTTIRTKDWLLKDMTYTFSLLYDSPDLNLADIKSDRTAIGPISLLRIFYQNAHLLKLTMKGFDGLRLTEMYYFQANVSLKTDQVAKLICLIPVATVMDDVNVIVGRTLLSELKTLYHPAVLSVVIFNKGDAHIEKNPQDLYDITKDESDKLVIAYYLVQERSLSKHLGLKYGRLDERNPFTLPQGEGCGSTATHELFFVSALQFSGIYESQNSNSRHYIAYDGLTNHLRIDLIGEYKMIYDLNEHRITYISDPDFSLDDRNKEEDLSHEDKTHCSQSPIMQVDDEEEFYKVKTIEEVIGLEKFIGLQYLGNVILDDGTHCMMFEREIPYSKIPIIVKMNINVKAQKNERIYIIYYFVDDLLISAKGNDFFNDLTSYQSMWLKRIEMMSRNSLTKSSALNAQITFNEFAWSLESISDDTRDRGSKILHPVRTFDTYECKSTHDQTKLEFVMKNVDKGDFDEKKAESSWNRMTEVLNQIESFEEAMIVFVSRQTRISRSLINKFEIIDAQPAASSLERDKKLFLVTANLITPMNFNFDKILVGWIDSINSIQIEKYGKFVKDARSISRTECSLHLATLFYYQNKVNMVYCPNVGCAYIVDLGSINYIEKDPRKIDASISTSSNMCEIYVQTKVVDSSKIIGDRFTSSLVQKSLNGSQMLFDVLNLSQESKFNTFRGRVIKTALIKGLSSDFLGHAIRYGLCYTKSTEIKGDRPFDLGITILKLEQYHSIIYCHEACHLDPNCQTYSFSKDSNECILTNIPSKYLLEPNIDGSIDLVGLRENKDCNLYIPNSLHLYQASKIVMLNSLSGLDSPYNNDKRYYMTVANLFDCASLCHSIELNAAKRIQCRKFIYFPTNSICVIEDKQSYLFETRDKVPDINLLEKTKHLMETVGRDNWFKVDLYHEYYRDYSQYYVINDWTKIEQSVKKQEAERDSKNSNHDAVNEIHDISGETTLYSLEKEDCLRECTIINPNCVMVDYCFNNIRGVPTRYCSMYTIRSPLLMNTPKLEPEDREEEVISSDSNPLTELERLYYKPNNFKLTSVRDYGCIHYYLTGDNLALKRQLAAAHSDSQQGSSEVISELANEDLESSREYLESLKQFSNPVTSKIGLVQICLSLLFGISTGCIMSLIISTWISRNSLVNTISWINLPASNLRDWFNNCRNERFGRTQRSDSHVGLDVELRDIKGEE